MQVDYELTKGLEHLCNVFWVYSVDYTKQKVKAHIIYENISDDMDFIDLLNII